MSSEGSAEIKSRVARHFSAPEWFTTFEFPLWGAVETEDGKERQLDALAISRIAGRGNEVVGIEVKSDRSDWLRELNNGAKSSTWLQLVDRFYVAASKDVVKKEELPAGWGFLEESGSGLKHVVHASLLSSWRANGRSDPIPREMWVRVLRRTLENAAIEPLLSAEFKRGHTQGTKDATEGSRREASDAKWRLDHLKEQVDAFEKASGLEIQTWAAGDIGKAVKAILANENLVQQVGNNTYHLRRRFEELNEALKAAGYNPGGES